jgi:hypothetical protein
MIRFNPLASENKTAGQIFVVDVRVSKPPFSNPATSDTTSCLRHDYAVLNSYSSFELNKIFPEA